MDRSIRPFQLHQLAIERFDVTTHGHPNEFEITLPYSRDDFHMGKDNVFQVSLLIALLDANESKDSGHQPVQHGIQGLIS
jgi:hypothetical protein